jgi:hypothetical protein
LDCIGALQDDVRFELRRVRCGLPTTWKLGAPFAQCRRADDMFLLSPPLPIVALGVSKPGVLLWIDEFKVENAVPILNMWEETSQPELSQTHVYDNYR